MLGGGCLTRPLPDPAGDGSSGDPDPDPGTTTLPLPDSTGPVTPPTSSTTDGGNTTEGSSTGPGGLGEGEECDLMLQECAPGLKCMPYSESGKWWWTDTACFPIDPDPVGMGEECQWFGGDFSGYDDCGFGQFCDSIASEPPVCRDLCRLPPGGDEFEDLYCPSPMTGPTTCQDCFCWCIPTCDPLVLDSCPEGQLCAGYSGYYDGTFSCIPDASGDMGAAGDPCEYVNVCDPGLMCLDAAATPGCMGLGCCSPFCDITQPNTCPFMDQECLPWWEDGEAPAGYENLGACALPQ